MTSFTNIYDAFLAKILEDEWGYWTEEEVREDMYQIMKAALPWFKFPRVDLTMVEDVVFLGDLTNAEIQIIASYMKVEWLNRTIMSWETIKPLYEERDFSQANLIDKLTASLQMERENVEKLESLYYRSINYKPFDYSRLTKN